jgi:DNA-binding CsgD family transcriptional regulator
MRGRWALAEGASPLTARETEVLSAARGHPAIADLAASLHLSSGTVRNHLSAAILKLGAQPRRSGPDSRAHRLALTPHPASTSRVPVHPRLPTSAPNAPASETR